MAAVCKIRVTTIKNLPTPVACLPGVAVMISRGGTMQMKSAKVYCLALGACLLAGQASAALPTGEYSCQVRTLNKKGGLVRVDADTIEQAERSAVGKEARTTSGAISLATQVIECIEKSETQFSDMEFQRFAEYLQR